MVIAVGDLIYFTCEPVNKSLSKDVKYKVIQTKEDPDYGEVAVIINDHNGTSHCVINGDSNLGGMAWIKAE